MTRVQVVVFAIAMVLVAVATVGQYQTTMDGQFRLFFPSTGLFGGPFRQAHERTPQGRDRTEIGCEQNGVFAFHAFGDVLLDEMHGSHHRKVTMYGILSDSASSRSEARARKAMQYVACGDNEWRRRLQCDGTGKVAVRTWTLTGEVSVMFEGNCDG
jgi:hypothetical protein